jgi:hypothetical protein
MREAGNRRGARTIGLALVAGLVAFEAALGLGAGAVGIPGLFLVRFAGESDGAYATQIFARREGGESVVAKLASPPVERAPQDAAPAGEPRLEGLADVPLQDWVLPRAKPAEARAFGEDAAPGEELPWDAVKPVPLTPDGADSSHDGATSSIPQASGPGLPLVPAALTELPADAAVEGWVKAKATEVKGEDRARPVYHFEFWLDAPEDVKRRLVAVSYAFDTPAVKPQAQISGDRSTGFRVSTGGLACADKVTVTLKFNDGRTQRVDVDGCRLLG